jgi:hypothetical protein
VRRLYTYEFQSTPRVDDGRLLIQWVVIGITASALALLLRR